jgi:hypothetical protein
MTEKIALIGFGEAAAISAAGSWPRRKRAFPYDLLAGEKSMADAARAAGVD